MKRSEEERRSDSVVVALLVRAGLVAYSAVACLGLFIDAGFSSPLFIVWLAGFVLLLLALSYVSLFSPGPLNSLPFLVLGVVALNLLVQASGGAHSFPWSVYFVYAALVAAFSPVLRTAVVVGLILVIETANLIVPKGHEAHWAAFAGFALSLVSVAGAVAVFRYRERRAEEKHERLIAHASSIDPLSDETRLATLTRERREAANVNAALERESAFGSFADFLDRFVQAHTYALYLVEAAPGGDALVLRGIRSPSSGRTAKVGDVLPSGAETAQQTVIAACARERRECSHDELTFPSMNLGYYTADVPVRSFFALPILNGKDMVGVLAVDSLEPQAFPPETRDILAASTPVFLHLIRSIQTSQDLEIRASYFRALHGMSAVLNSSLDLGGILSRLTGLIGELAPHELCVFVRYDEETKDAVVLHRSGPAVSGARPSLLGSAVSSLMHLIDGDGGERESGEERFPAGESGVLGRMLKEQEGGRVTPYHFHDFGGRGEGVGLFGEALRVCRPLRSLSVWPLSSGDKFVGACFLGSERAGAFSELQIGVLDTLMNQVAVVVENALLHRRMSERALTDGLTGLLNHRTFMERLDGELSRLDREPQPFSLLLLDIDHFKRINDTYGHPVGDIALRTVAGIVRGSVRTIDAVARYGGEEFAVGLVGADGEGAEQMAERIRKTVEKTQVAAGSAVFTCAVSVGVATLKLGREKKEGLLGRADAALYYAKQSGRNRVCRHELLAEADLAAAAEAAARKSGAGR